MDIVPEILNRFSVREFTAGPVEKSKIENIINAGTLAPSAKNRQEWRFIIVQKPELKEKIKDASFGQDFVGQAAAIIAVCTTNIDYIMPNGELSYPIDCTFAASHMMLQATREGLGSCCITTFDNEDVKRILQLPFKMKIVMLILVGHTKAQPVDKSRKKIGRVSSYNHW